VSHPLLTAPIGRSLWRLAGPTTGLMIVQILFSVAETWIVGRLGTDALAGFVLVVPFLVLMINTANGGIGGGVFRVGGGVSPPRALDTPDPEYSEEARKAKYQGTCVLWLIVGPDGRPRDIKIARSLGLGLDEKAIEAVRNWKFEPAMKDGKPVAVQINVEVSFRLY